MEPLDVIGLLTITDVVYPHPNLSHLSAQINDLRSRQAGKQWERLSTYKKCTMAETLLGVSSYDLYQRTFPKAWNVVCYIYEGMDYGIVWPLLKAAEWTPTDNIRQWILELLTAWPLEGVMVSQKR